MKFTLGCQVVLRAIRPQCNFIFSTNNFRCYSVIKRKNNVDDLLFIKSILKESTHNIDLAPTGLGNILLPSQYALLARLGFKEDLALPDQLARTALSHPSRYPDNTFFESLLFYGTVPR